MDVAIVFMHYLTQAAVFFKGFAHEYPLSSWSKGNLEKWQKVLNKVPGLFSTAVFEPAFEMDCISFCFWRSYADESWYRGGVETVEKGDSDGSAFLLVCIRILQRNIMRKLLHSRLLV
jgi:hypothetical protein